MTTSQLQRLIDFCNDVKNVDMMDEFLDVFNRRENDTAEDIGVLGLLTQFMHYQRYMQFLTEHGHAPSLFDAMDYGQKIQEWEDSISIDHRYRAMRTPYGRIFYSFQWYQTFMEWNRTKIDPERPIMELFLEQHPTGDTGEICHL